MAQERGPCSCLPQLALCRHPRLVAPLHTTSDRQSLALTQAAIDCLQAPQLADLIDAALTRCAELDDPVTAARATAWTRQPAADQGLAP